jgi:hypothetical protein
VRVTAETCNEHYKEQSDLHIITGNSTTFCLLVDVACSTPILIITINIVKSADPGGHAV